MRQVAFEELEGEPVIVEEKLDGANSGFSFDERGRLRLQSRGHLLRGGPREAQFDRFKQWGATLREALFERLRDRYVVYGEWLYAHHAIYYDALPDYFVEFDVLDLAEGVFLDTSRRRALLSGLPITSAPVVAELASLRESDLAPLISRSAYQTPEWAQTLRRACVSRRIDPSLVLERTDRAGLMEGFYLKVERGGVVVQRCKWVRPSFTQAVEDAGEHWMRRPIVPNTLGTEPAT
ncbi:MAG: RNA ligase family protein [Sandaracinaceae bacterium]|nr:RNA ligase family protein [Sandaracinaceae bacterium]